MYFWDLGSGLRLASAEYVDKRALYAGVAAAAAGVSLEAAGGPNARLVGAVVGGLGGQGGRSVGSIVCLMSHVAAEWSGGPGAVAQCACNRIRGVAIPLHPSSPSPPTPPPPPLPQSFLTSPPSPPPQ